MAIKISDYEPFTNNIKIHKKDKRKFLFDFRIEGKRIRKTYTVKATNWSKADCKKAAIAEFAKVVEKEYLKFGSSLSPGMKIDDLYMRFYDQGKKTDWEKTKKSFYDRIISPIIGKLKAESIREHHIQNILKHMEEKGYELIDKQGKPVTDDQGKPIHRKYAQRTKRTVLDVLIPFFNWLMRNDVITKNPAKFITIKIPSQKKIVTNATQTFKVIYNGIQEYYKDQPFYKALFLFGFTGRRKSEILNLKWENVDLINGYYWIEDTKNSEKQKYPLPTFIKTALEEIKDNRQGLVFKSQKTGLKIKNTDRQMNQLKKFLDMPELTLHYMRNIIVSSLAEQGVEAVYLSGILGHRDINTINKYLSNNHFKSGEVGLGKIDNILDAEVL